MSRLGRRFVKFHAMGYVSAFWIPRRKLPPERFIRDAMLTKVLRGRNAINHQESDVESFARFLSRRADRLQPLGVFLVAVFFENSPAAANPGLEDYVSRRSTKAIESRWAGRPTMVSCRPLLTSRYFDTKEQRSFSSLEHQLIRVMNGEYHHR